MLLQRRSDKIDILKNVPLFSSLSKRHLNEIAKYADELPMKAGDILALEGTQGREFDFILEGEARVEQDGKIINHLSTGDFFGEISLIDGEPQTATVIAETNGTLLVVNRRSFNQLLDSVPGLPQKMLIALCRYLRRAEKIAHKR